MRRRWLLLALTTAACLRQTEYHCTVDSECGPQGVCEQSVMFCSFPDATCGRKFSDSAGPYANECVGTTPGLDAGVDGPPMHSDAAMDAPNQCPPDFSSTGGLQHVYKLIAMTNDWMMQSAACTASGSGAYLAIPDDPTELAALDALAGAPLYWVGIDDLANEGTFVTVKGAPATYLPWATGQPDNAANSDCVAAISASAQIQDDKCNTHYPAICECEP